MPITVQEHKKTGQDKSISGQNRKNFGIVKYDAPLTATEVADLKKLLTDKFDTCNDVTLEFTGLTDCDTLGIQLLLSANQTAKARNSKFSIKGDIDTLHTAAQRIGLSFEEYFNQEKG